MKISLNVVKWFLGFELPAIDELAIKIGAQLGAVESVDDLGKKYQGIVMAKVVKCEKIEGSDHLSLCRIDDGGAVKDVQRGDDGLVQVVCGAPNCREGLLVAWLPPGSTVPTSAKESEPFVLSARDIRGHTSNGMLASPKELALGDSHDGILEITGKYQPGSDFAEVFGLKDEFIIDIENKMFTHRPDCFGFMGVARELAGIYQQPFKPVDWYVTDPEFAKPEVEVLELTIKNELPELVPRFSAIVLSNVQVGDSPMWLQDGLGRLGQKSVNNIVDYTNWYMLETGQPLHAYDYDKIKAMSDGGASLVIRQPHHDEMIKLLNGKVVKPRAEAVMIATDKKAVGIGGVMGGTETEVDADTTNIILECANFDMYSVRRTIMEHGLFTEAATRFTKGQSPLQNLAVLSRIVKEIREHAGGKIASEVYDDKHLDQSVLERGSLHPPVSVSTDFINQRLGLKLSASEICKLLENVEFKVETDGEELTIMAPFWRTDIELREDVVEEVGRLYGYDHVPLVLPLRDLTPAAKNDLMEAKDRVRERLSLAGANEVLTYSFVHGDLLQKVGQDPKQAFQLSNALSPDLQYYRLSLLPNLLEKVHTNIKAGYDEFALFEIGKTHGQEHIEADGLPVEHEFTGLVVAASDKLKKSGAAYYDARLFLENLVGVDLEFKPVDESMQKYPVVQPYDLKRAAVVSIKGGDFLGIIGELKASVIRSLKLPKHVAGFEIDTAVLTAVLEQGPTYVPLSRFPKVTQDITLKVPVELPYNELHNLVSDELAQASESKINTRLEPLDIFQRDDDEQHRQVSFRVTAVSYERTLTDPEVNKLLDTVAGVAKSKLGAERL